MKYAISLTSDLLNSLYSEIFPMMVRRACNYENRREFSQFVKGYNLPLHMENMLIMSFKAIEPKDGDDAKALAKMMAFAMESIIKANR